MDADETPSRRRDNAANMLVKEDLDPFSVEELEARIRTLEAEIERTRQKMQRAVQHRASAESLFKR